MGDHFSKQASTYKKFRPTYPKELFEYVSSLCKEHGLAWDCATGSGQAAIDIAEYFNRVIATDLSAKQLEQASIHPKIQYQVGSSDSCPFIGNHSVDLITVAQAYHWFDEEKFFTEARRVLKPGGILAIWNYDWAEVESEIDTILNSYGKGLLTKYWPPDVQKRAKPDRVAPQGFEILKAPKFVLKTNWNFEQMRGYLDSWSAVQIYKDINKSDPFEMIESALKAAWGEAQTPRLVQWPLYLLIARKV